MSERRTADQRRRDGKGEGPKLKDDVRHKRKRFDEKDSDSDQSTPSLEQHAFSSEAMSSSSASQLLSQMLEKDRLTSPQYLDASDETPKVKSNHDNVRKRGVSNSDPELELVELSSSSEEVDTEHIAPEDPFVKHLELNLNEDVAEKLLAGVKCAETEIEFPVLGPFMHRLPEITVRSTPDVQLSKPLDRSHVRANLLKNVDVLADPWTDLSTEMFSLMNSYTDVHAYGCTQRTDITRAYCLHSLNHILKTRNRVIAHNSKITRANKSVSEFRDQGFTRPKVLMLVPFRQNAYQIFATLCELLGAKDDMQIMNRKRFVEEFGWSNHDPVANADKPEDFREAFLGNTDDCFRVGIGIAKKTLKMFTEFYSADILIASPLGLRMIVGGEDEKQHEFDFLSSIEILIMDRTDMFLMQNWEHVTHIMKYMHRQPKTTRNVDFTRVRSWTLNGWSKLYRQTLVFSAFRSPEIQSLVSRHCYNYAGTLTTKLEVLHPQISSVVVSAPHTFHRVPNGDYQSMSDVRFAHFTEKVFPQFLESAKTQTMIFIPSYFDFVRIRNHFKREEISFVQICEYTSPSKIARARDLFFHGKKHFLLYTERFHFFRRYIIRGVRHLLFYELPHYAHYYPELSNMLVAGEDTALTQFTIDTLFSKLDTFSLIPVVGLSKGSSMLRSEKSLHTFVTTPSSASSF